MRIFRPPTATPDDKHPDVGQDVASSGVSGGTGLIDHDSTA